MAISRQFSTYSDFVQEGNYAVHAVEDVAYDVRISSQGIAKHKMGIALAELLRRQQKVDEKQNIEKDQNAVAWKRPIILQRQHDEEKDVDEKQENVVEYELGDHSAHQVERSVEHNDREDRQQAKKKSHWDGVLRKALRSGKVGLKGREAGCDRDEDDELHNDRKKVKILSRFGVDADQVAEEPLNCGTPFIFATSLLMSNYFCIKVPDGSFQLRANPLTFQPKALGLLATQMLLHILRQAEFSDI